MRISIIPMVIGLALFAGAAFGVALALWGIPAIEQVIVERETSKYLKSGHLPIAYHVYSLEDVRRFVEAVLPLGISVSERSAEKMLKVVRETYAAPYKAALTPPASDEVIATYLEKTGLLTEMNLGREAALEALRSIDPSIHHLVPAMDYCQYYPSFPESTALAQLRLPAEFEPQGAVVLAWPIYYPFRWDEHTQFTTAIASVAEAHILVPDVYWQKAVELYLRAKNVSTDHIRFIHARVEDVWTRDYMPATVLDRNQRPYLIANPYIQSGPPFNKGEQEAPMELGKSYGVPLIRLPVVIEGGNIISDGQGTIMLFDSVFKMNQDITPEKLKAVFARYFGARRVILFPALKGEFTGHIDMVVKFVDCDRLMVASSDPSYKWHGDFEAIAKRLSETPSSNGRPYEVIRVPMAISNNASPDFWSYVNSLTVNGKVIIPMYGVSRDQAAIALYKRAMPNYEVIGIDFRDFPLGSVHCQSKEIPASLFQNRVRDTGSHSSMYVPMTRF